jgi:hypothetical protein
MADTKAPTAPTAPPVPPKAPTAPAAPAAKTAAPKKPRNKLPELDLSAIGGVLAVTTPETMHKFRPQRADRSEQQQRIDSYVQKAYQTWEKAGRPEKWEANHPHGVQLSVREDQLASLQAAIRKGGDHYNFRIRFGLVITSEHTDENTKKVSTVAQFVFIATDRSNTSDPTD